MNVISVLNLLKSSASVLYMFLHLLSVCNRDCNIDSTRRNSIHMSIISAFHWTLLWLLFHCGVFGWYVEVCCVPAVGLFWPTFIQVWGDSHRRSGAERRGCQNHRPLLPAFHFHPLTSSAQAFQLHVYGSRNTEMWRFYSDITALRWTQASQMNVWCLLDRTEDVCEMCLLLMEISVLWMEINTYSMKAWISVYNIVIN